MLAPIVNASSRLLLRPESVDEALRLQQAHGARIRWWTGVGTEAPQETPQRVSQGVFQEVAQAGFQMSDEAETTSPTPADEVLVDTGRISEMAGLHQLGGIVVIGLNMTCADVARASLTRAMALGLTEAAEHVSDPGLRLGAGLFARSTPAILLALVALDAEIVVATLAAAGQVERRWLALEQGLTQVRQAISLPLAVRFQACGEDCGSALVVLTLPAGTEASVQGAAVCLRLDTNRSLTAAKLALLVAGDMPQRLAEVEASLIGRPLDAASIEEAAHLSRPARGRRTARGYRDRRLYRKSDRLPRPPRARPRRGPGACLPVAPSDLKYLWVSVSGLIVFFRRHCACTI